MTNQLHTVLGASGAIGRAVIQELQNRNLTIRGVERSPKMKGIEILRQTYLIVSKQELLFKVQVMSIYVLDFLIAQIFG